MFIASLNNFILCTVHNNSYISAIFSSYFGFSFAKIQRILRLKGRVQYFSMQIIRGRP